MCGATNAEGRVRGNLKFAAFWLLYLLYPGWYLVSESRPRGTELTGLILLAVFLTGYLCYWANAGPEYGSDDVSPRSHRGYGAAYVLFTVGIAVTLAVLTRSAGFLGMIIYAAPAVAWWSRPGAFYGAMGFLVAAALLPLPLLHAVTTANILSVTVPILSVGLGMRVVFRYAMMQQKLLEIRSENELLAAANERLRIARDLHDVLGHTLSSIAMRADVARVEVERTAPQAALEMGTIARLAREALGDVRTVVTGYRRVRIRDEWASVQDALRAAGVSVEGVVDDASLPAHVERTLGLILREACTNVARHSGASWCEVEVRREPGAVVLKVQDNGSNKQAIVPGNGLRGMAERVSSLKGNWSVSGGQGSGVALEVRLPISEETRGTGDRSWKGVS